VYISTFKAVEGLQIDLVISAEEFEGLRTKGAVEVEEVTVGLGFPDGVASATLTLARKVSDWWTKYAVISERRDGERLIGDAGPFAEDLYAAGTPPVHGLTRPSGISVRVAQVRIGDRLTVERHDRAWVVSDAAGVLGRLRWRPGDDGRVDARTGATIRYPATGVLHVERVVLSAEHDVVDVGGTVYPG